MSQDINTLTDFEKNKLTEEETLTDYEKLEKALNILTVDILKKYSDYIKDIEIKNDYYNQQNHKLQEKINYLESCIENYILRLTKVQSIIDSFDKDKVAINKEGKVLLDNLIYDLRYFGRPN